MNVADAPTQVLDRSAALQEHVRAFTALYEEAAYVVYNVALRITCEREAAMQTAERAFLAQVDHENDQVRLIASTARVALSMASERPDPHGAGDEECEALLALNAQLPPLERAALALGALIEADDDTIAQLLGITTDAVARLLHHGTEMFAELRGSSPEETAAAIDGWLLAEPPPALWETIYPAFHRRVETQLEARPLVEQTAAAAPAAQPAPAPTERAPRFARARARVRATLWTVAVLAILGGGGYAAAAALSGGGSSGTQSTVGQRPLPPGVTGGDGSMSPQELDRLRQREIQAQARTPAEHGGRPSTGPRVPSKSKQDALLRRAKANQLLAKKKEAKRERAIARQRQKAASHSTPAVPPPTPPPSTPRAHTAPTTTSGATGNTPTSSTPSSPPSSTTSSGDGAPTTSQANQNCLLNPDTGTYVCPK